MKSDIKPFTRILWVWVGAFIGWLLGVGFDGRKDAGCYLLHQTRVTCMHSELSFHKV
jgi:hypothetical protein